MNLWVYTWGCQGLVDPSHVKFEHGYSSWVAGQLEDELHYQQWFIASAAPELITRIVRHDQTLWHEILNLMGGEYAEVARRNAPVS
ncbi:unnamed protein product [Choristocarpus tenellus]